VGFAEEHPHDIYRVLDLKTQGVMLTRDLRWSGKIFDEFFHTGSSKIMDGIELESSDEKEIILQKSTEAHVQKERKEPEKY
jgi:hypothetical protein